MSKEGHRRPGRVDARPQASAHGRRGAGPKGWLALASLASLVAGTWWAGLPVFVPAVYLGMSLVAFVAYALDKRAAQAGRRRTPESTLHLMAIFGGWPGAMAAQHWLRHKSVKRAFLAMFWTTVLLNLGALAFWIHQARA